MVHGYKNSNHESKVLILKNLPLGEGGRMLYFLSSFTPIYKVSGESNFPNPPSSLSHSSFTLLCAILFRSRRRRRSTLHSKTVLNRLRELAPAVARFTQPHRGMYTLLSILSHYRRLPPSLDWVSVCPLLKGECLALRK